MSATEQQNTVPPVLGKLPITEFLSNPYEALAQLRETLDRAV